MDPPDATIVDERDVAGGRVRSLIRTRDEDGQLRWLVAEIDRIVDCGARWARAVELLAVAELPTRSSVTR